MQFNKLCRLVFVIVMSVLFMFVVNNSSAKENNPLSIDAPDTVNQGSFYWITAKVDAEVSGPLSWVMIQDSCGIKETNPYPWTETVISPKVSFNWRQCSRVFLTFTATAQDGTVYTNSVSVKVVDLDFEVEVDGPTYSPPGEPVSYQLSHLGYPDCDVISVLVNVKMDGQLIATYDTTTFNAPDQDDVSYTLEWHYQCIDANSPEHGEFYLAYDPITFLYVNWTPPSNHHILYLPVTYRAD